MVWVHPGGGPWPPPDPHRGGGGLVGRLAPVCARRCGRVCGAVRVMRCNAICSFCSTRQVAALSQLTVRDATTQFVVCSATTKCQPSALQRASGKRTLLATPAGGVGTMVAGGFAVTLCHHSPHPPFPQGGGGGFPTEHDHWGGVGGGAKEAWNIYSRLNKFSSVHLGHCRLASHFALNTILFPATHLSQWFTWPLFALKPGGIDLDRTLRLTLRPHHPLVSP